jgi:hypothetical protein
MFRVLTAAFLLTGPAGLALADDALSASEKAEGFVLLFDGKTLDNWVAFNSEWEPVPIANSNFSIVDQTLLASGKDKSYWIRYEKPFGDLVLRLEYKVGKGANSGIFFHVPPGKDHPAFTGFEVQILDDCNRQPSKDTTGSIYDVITPMRNMSKPTGEWNSLEVTCRGSTVTVVHNGFKVVDVDFATLTEPIGKFKTPYAQLPRSGYFGLQSHGGQVAFRNVRIKPLDK